MYSYECKIFMAVKKEGHLYSLQTQRLKHVHSFIQSHDALHGTNNVCVCVCCECGMYESVLLSYAHLCVLMVRHCYEYRL